MAMVKSGTTDNCYRFRWNGSSKNRHGDSDDDRVRIDVGGERDVGSDTDGLLSVMLDYQDQNSVREVLIGVWVIKGERRLILEQ